VHAIDWLVVGAYLAWVIYDGLKRTRESDKVEGYFLANRSLPWWAVGLSVMATQMSAITLVGTTGQGYRDGLRFVQFYFGLPIAMLILGVTVVPFFHRARVFTAYEYLERRFDVKTRTLTSLLFLLSRGMSCGVVIAAPSVILSIILGWNLTLTVLLIGVPTAVYTMLGGVQAVTWTDVKQMVVIVLGVGAAIARSSPGCRRRHPRRGHAHRGRHRAAAVARLPVQPDRDVHVLVGPHRRAVPDAVVLRVRPEPGAALPHGALDRGGAHVAHDERLREDPDAGGHSARRGPRVRVLPVRAVADALQPEARAADAHGTRGARLRRARGAVHRGARRARAAARAAAEARRGGQRPPIEATAEAFRNADAVVEGVRAEAMALVRVATGDLAFTDVNYVFPTFVITQLPVGLIGLLIAAIFAAAMSTIASELNSLATASVIDIYRRLLRPVASDSHYLAVSRVATGFWGLVACGVAVYATTLGSLIEVVNRFGSFFYGSLLGVFVLAIGTRRATGTGAFAGLIGGMATVAYVAFWHPQISFLWHNVIGAVTVTAIGMIISLAVPRGAAGHG
jgi:solute:Na+ symporter, SSS family